MKIRLSVDKFLNHHNRAHRGTVKSSTHMSSGKRVNSFADDAGGANVSIRLNARSKSLDRATRNINEAIRAATTTDAGMNDIQSHLTRMRELAVQSANAVLGSADRALAHKEFSQLRQEINRFSLSVNYNDTIKLLSNDNIMQIGFLIDASGSMGGEINNLKNGILNGASTFATLLTGLQYNAQFGLSVLARDTDGTKTVVNFANSGAFNSELNALYTIGAYIDPFAGLANVLGVENNTPSSNTPDDSFGFLDEALKHIIYVTDTGREIDQLDSPAIPNETPAAMGQLLADNSVTLHVMGGHGLLGTIAGITGGSQQGMAGNGSNVPSLLDNIFDDIVAAADAVPEGQPAMIMAGDDANEVLKATVAGFTLPAGLGLNNISIDTVAGARSALSVIDAAIDNVSSQRAAVGASMQQLMVEHSNVLNESTNMKEAAAKIEDVDMAEQAIESTINSMKATSSINAMRVFHQVHGDKLLKLLS